MYAYRGLTSGQTDDISFKGAYVVEDKEDVGPRSWPKGSYYRSKESLHLKRI